MGRALEHPSYGVDVGMATSTPLAFCLASFFFEHAFAWDVTWAVEGSNTNEVAQSLERCAAGGLK